MEWKGLEAQARSFQLLDRRVFQVTVGFSFDVQLIVSEPRAG